MTIVVAEFMDAKGREILSEAGAVHYDPQLWKDPKKLARVVTTAEALVVRNRSQVTSTLMKSAERLAVIGRLGVGLDNIDVKTARDRGVVVVTAQGANAVAVAEYVFAAMLHFSRNLSEVDRTVRSGEWDRSLGGFELYGKTLGLLGLGDVGQRVAFRAKAFGMNVVAYDPMQVVTHMAAMELGVTLGRFEEILGRSDFVSVHVPLTPSTRHLIDASSIANMHKGTYLINTARGGVVNEEDLLKGLNSGRLAGVALDVRSHEPPDPSDALLDHPRVLLTPHTAGLTQEAGVRTARMVAQDVVRVLEGQRPLAAV